MEDAILVVDDDEYCRKTVIDMLKDAGHQDVLEASNADAGLKVFKENSEKIALIISDYKMPGMNGDEFLEIAFSLKPSLKRILMSGDTSNFKNLRLSQDIIILAKPFPPDLLLDTVELLSG